MEPEDITLDGELGGSQLNPSNPEGAAPAIEAQAPETLTLQELEQQLGKKFPDKATALKSLKDTYSYVGKRKEDIAAELSQNNTGVANEIKEIKDNLFFDKNPQFEPYRKVIAKLGSNPQEVIQSEDFKAIFEKAAGFDETQKLKSVLTSNPRIAQTKDTLTKAREAKTSDERDSLLAQAVLGTVE